MGDNQLKIGHDDISGEQIIESFPAVDSATSNGGRDADSFLNRKRSKPLISSFSTAANSKQAGSSTHNIYSAKRNKQFDSVMPKVNSFSRGSTVLPPKASLQVETNALN